MRQIILAALFASALIITVEIAFRATGGVPAIPQGKTSIEFQWKVRDAAWQSERKTIYVIGDSRVEWGFAERVFNESLTNLGRSDLLGINAGSPAASAAKLSRAVLSAHHGQPGVLVLNFSPCSFFQFEQSPGPPAENLKLQDMLDDQIDIYLKERIWTWGRRPSALAEHAGRVLAGKPTRDVVWYDRLYTTDGVLSLKGRYNDDAHFDLREWTLEQYQRMFSGLQGSARIDRRKAELLTVVADARQAGWKVVLVRLPIGQTMLHLESQLPDGLHLQDIAADLNVPTLDYQGDPRLGQVHTVDESHVDQPTARRLAALLAADIIRLIDSPGQDSLNANSRASQ